MSALGYADDVTIIAPSLHGLKHMLKLCEVYAVEYHIKYNPLKCKLVCYSIKNVSRQLFGQNTEVVEDVMYLGNDISNDIWKKNTIEFLL